MARLEYYVLNDADLSFKDILKRSLSGEPLVDKKELEEWEESRRKLSAARKDGDVSNDDNDDEEKKSTKKAKIAARKKKRLRKGGRRMDNGGESEHEEENGDEEPMEEGGEEDDEVAAATQSRPLTAAVEKPSAAEKAKAVERAAILAPQLNLQQIEAAIAKGSNGGYDQDMINELMAQTYAASVRWPRDKVLHVRLRHIVASIEEGGRWPVPPHSLLLEQTAAEDSGTATPEPGANGNNHGLARDTSTPLSEVRTVP